MYMTLQTPNCAGCGRRDHLVQVCPTLGCTLHGFINCRDVNRAMAMILPMTNRGLQELQKRLDTPLPIYNINDSSTRGYLLDALKIRWYEIRIMLVQMIKDDVTIMSPTTKKPQTNVTM